ncbi:MAG: hypothetical protein ABIR68_06545 [Ilumatobacteraceae bacterium]
MGRRLRLLLGVLLIVVGVLVVAGESVVDEHLLRPGLYTSALSENTVYRRVYSEVLTDPQVRTATDHLLGDFSLGGRDLADTTALSNALLRLALPPATIRDLTEQFVRQVLAYIAGDRDRLDTSLDLASTLARLDSTATVTVRGVLATATTQLINNLPDYETAVRSFADQLAAGQIPTSVPVVGGSAVSAAQVQAVLDASGLPADVREQVDAALQSGTERDALITAATSFARVHLTRLSTSLASSGPLRIDLLEVLGTSARAPRQQAIASVDSLRSTVRWIPGWSRFVAFAVVLGGFIIVVRAQRHRPARALAFVGGALVLSALTLWVGWWAVTSRVRSPIAAAADRTTSPNLPPSVSAILGDLDRTLSHELRAIRDHDVRILLLVGSLAVAGAVTWLIIVELVRRGPRLPIAAVAAVMVVLGVTAVVGPGRTAIGAPRECNGHRELCARPYDHVVQAATHNSMSSPDVVQIWPEHDANIAAQLDAGIRTLLIDTKYWTAITTPSDLSTVEQFLPADVTTSLFAFLGDRLRAHPGTYLCHSRCAYGAIPFESALRTVKAFLDANPDEVVTLIIQDQISTADTQTAMDDSGIANYLYDGSPTTAWPTFGELIDADHRLVVFSEASGPPPAWYHPYLADVQDTEYHVTSAADLDCTLKRGRADAPLFLLNHWIQREAPDRADALAINQRAAIVDRARRCRIARGKLPNFIAVNFFSLGDVIGAVNELNGVA